MGGGVIAGGASDGAGMAGTIVVGAGAAWTAGSAAVPQVTCVAAEAIGKRSDSPPAEHSARINSMLIQVVPVVASTGMISAQARPSASVAISTDLPLSEPIPAGAPPVIVYFTIQSATGSLVVWRTTQVQRDAWLPGVAQTGSGNIHSASIQWMLEERCRASQE